MEDERDNNSSKVSKVPFPREGQQGVQESPKHDSEKNSIAEDWH